MITPLVSIITPCFNSEEYLPRYFESILRQDYNNIQLIIVNDGSSDETATIIQKYKATAETRGMQFNYIFQENQGLGAAINTGLKYIRGEYFTWCDSDNFYSPDYISTKVDFFLTHPEYSIVRCDGYVVNEHDVDTPIETMAHNNHNIYEDHLFLNCLLNKDFHFGCAMLRTSDFDTINKEREIYPSRAGQNWQLLLPMFYSYRAGYIDKPMFYFVIRNDSISHISSLLDYQAQIKEQDEHLKIIQETLKSISMTNNEREMYIEMVQIKYSKLKMNIYAKAMDKAGIKKEYTTLKAYKAVDFSVWLHRIYGHSFLLHKLKELLN